MHFLNFFGIKKSSLKIDPKPWATPLQKHQKSIDRVFHPKNEDFYYGVYNIKLILLIQGNV